MTSKDKRECSNQERIMEVVTQDADGIELLYNTMTGKYFTMCAFGNVTKPSTYDLVFKWGVDVNQCDGCTAGLPKKNGVHRDGQPMGIACTAYLYARGAEDV